MAEEQPPAPDPESNSSNDPASGGGEPSIDLNNLDAAAIEEILKQASFEDPAEALRDSAMAAVAGTAMETAAPAGAGATPELPPTDELALPNFQQVIQDAQMSSIDLLRDVDLNVKIELGRSHMLVEDVLKLGEGSVVELDKLAGDPVDVFVNERLVARGEVLVLNDNFCVRINEIVAGIKDEGL
jgi:flagellar motor switch protein FliN/FliY